MTDTEKAIVRSILELEAAVAAPPGGQPRPSLRPYLEQLRALIRELPPGTDPTLRHYLQKQSWEKARLFLLGREAENTAGRCGHVH